MKKLTLLIALLLLLSTAGIAAAEEQQIEFKAITYTSLQSGVAGAGGTGADGFTTGAFQFNHIEDYADFGYSVTALATKSPYNHAAIGGSSACTDVEFWIGDTKIGEGRYSWVMNAQGYFIVNVAADTWNIGDLTGAKTVTFIAKNDNVIIYGRPDKGSITSPSGGKGYCHLGYYSPGSRLIVGTTTVYQMHRFNQYVNYEINSDSISISYVKNGVTNEVKFKDDQLDVVHTSTNAEDFSKTFVDTEYLIIDVENPYDSEKNFKAIIPETAGTGYTNIIYDTQHGLKDYMGVNCDYTIEKYIDTVWTSYQTGHINGRNGDSALITYDNGARYRITFSAVDYTSYVKDYATNIENVQTTFETAVLFPDYGEHISVSFKAHDKRSLAQITDYTVYLDGEGVTVSKTPDAAGYCIFTDIPKGDYTFTAVSPGYNTILDMQTWNNNPNVKQLSFDTEGAAQLQLYFRDALHPNIFVEADYTIYEMMGGEWVDRGSSRAYGGHLIANLNKGSDYKVLYTVSDQYLPGFVVFEPFYQSTIQNVYLQSSAPEGDYSVIFRVEESTGSYPISGATVTFAGQTGYTNSDGLVGFLVASGEATHTISKAGYNTITGTNNIESERYIIVTLTASSSPVTPPPTLPPGETPTSAPDITKPTNIIESLKFAFAKLFGLDSGSAEGVKQVGILLALLLIIGAAGGVAMVTKDGMGALIGAGIGLVFGIALGLIPIWILFVGVAGIVLLLVLFKGGGNQ